MPRFQIVNDTDEPLQRTLAEGDADSLPALLAAGGTAEWEGNAGRVRYEGATGQMELFWPGSPGEGPIQVGLVTGYDISGSRGDPRIVLRKPGSQPVQRQALPAAPNGTSVVDDPDPLVQRRRIAKAAQDELDEWRKIASNEDLSDDDIEELRIRLRQKYLDATTGLDITQLKAQAKSHTNTSTHWCGIFATWNVQHVRNDQVLWRFGSRPQNVLHCTDTEKLHIGDIGHLMDDPVVINRYKAWQDRYNAAYAAHADVADKKERARLAGVDAGPAPAAPRNHHVLVTEISGTSVKIIQGNSGDAAKSPYPSYGLVTPGSLLRRPRGQREPGKDIDYFYCSAPPRECKQKAADKKSESCPVADGLPCVKPGP
jgi:hypothetical protein